MGDQLLQEIAGRLLKVAPDNGIVSRLSGDEFTIAIKGEQPLEDLKEFSRNLLHTLSVPVRIVESTFYVSASIGISRYPHNGDNVLSLLKCADLAMYRAKHK